MTYNVFGGTLNLVVSIYVQTDRKVFVHTVCILSVFVAGSVCLRSHF